VSDRSPAEIRMDLARGHWSLQERDEAVDCLVRASSDDPGLPGLAELIEAYASESGDARLRDLHSRL